jgi:hypothetical protein
MANLLGDEAMDCSGMPIEQCRKRLRKTEGLLDDLGVASPASSKLLITGVLPAQRNRVLEPAGFSKRS